jgi:hypothetical protein
MLDATGFGPLALGAVLGLAKNGVLVAGRGDGRRAHRRAADGRDEPAHRPRQPGHRRHGQRTLRLHRRRRGPARAEATHPGWLGSLLTTRIDGLTGYAETLDRLEHDDDAIKVYVEVARQA